MPPGESTNRETWARVNDLFHRALDRREPERAAFVLASCDDPHIRDEVLSLLGAHDRATTFIETPIGSVPMTSAAAPLPARIGGYEVRGVLGQGGMGVVYLAEDVRLGRLVALKAIAPRFVGDPARRERLRREARAAAALHHPGIATVFALEEIDNHLYIAGEYVPGETLRDELDRGPLDPGRAVDTTIAVARALAAAHDRGVVHRDLKPENLMRTPGGDVKILDFGLARMLDASPGEAALTSDGSVLGTPAYMSPEQIRRATIDPRSDLFSLGIILYELVTGRNPFSGADPASTIAKILEAEPPRFTDRPLSGGTAPPLGALERVVLKCLEKQPADRYVSARELVNALEASRQPTGAGAPSVSGAAPRTTDAVGHGALWWWQFHQAAAAIGYALLLVPLWRLRDMSSGQFGTVLFVAGLAAATAAISVRLHLWFASNLDRAAWRAQHPRSAPWRLAGDVLFAAVLAAEGARALLLAESWGMLLVAAAAGVLVSFAVVEPATARAALDQTKD